MMDSWQFVLIAVPPLCVVKISLFASQTHVALKQLLLCGKAQEKWTEVALKL